MKEMTFLRNRLVTSTINDDELNAPSSFFLSEVGILRTSCADAPHIMC